MSSGQLCNSRVQLFRAGNPSYPAAASPSSPSCNRIHFSESANRLIHLWPVLPMDERVIGFVMLEVHRGFVDVVVGCDPMLACNLRHLLDVFNIVSANVD